ncbi:hypothetical protein K2X05_07635 [bacterium]|nr:hypothetical protein [bacterium]
MTNWKMILKDVVAKPEMHARLLNTLSLLEYIGARKIMKSQEETQITPTVLAHMTEEIRHAQILKKLAMKVGGERVLSYSEESLLCGEEGRAYIQAIDRKACEVVGEKNSLVNYLLTTLIVEERAQELYPYYDELLAPLGLSGPLRAIFREEEEHLAQVISALKNLGGLTETEIELVRQEERIYFAAFFAAVSQKVQKVPSPFSANVEDIKINMMTEKGLGTF